MIEGTDTFEDEVNLQDYPDVESFVEHHQLKDKFRCSVFKEDDGELSFQQVFPNRMPPAAEVVKLFGAGKIKWVVAFEDKDPVTQRRRKPLEFTMKCVGPHWDEIHEEYRQQKQEEALKKYKARMDKMRTENLYGGVGAGGMLQLPKDPDEMETKFLKQMGMLKALSGNDGAKDNTFMLGFLKMMSDASTAAQQNMQNFMQMMMQMNMQQAQMTMGLLTKGQGSNPMEFMMPLMTNMLNFTQKTMEIKKDMENDPEPDRLTTILEFAKEVLPAAFAMLSRVPAPMRGPMVKAATSGNKDFDALKNDPELLAKALGEWDKVYGPEKVDELLKHADIQRPASTFQNYEKYGKPAEDVSASDVDDQSANGTAADHTEVTGAESATAST